MNSEPGQFKITSTYFVPMRAEGDEDFENLQRFLATVHTLAGERRLSRYMYLAAKPPV